ncbi:MAG: tetratricopeptide repeat protein [bacterium]|nr:tetratricopeptide repeat protein [bacterium]
MEYDLFISHASEDKAEFVEPLVGALGDRGLRVWYDSREIALGDDFRFRMDEGLALSSFGVVVVSPSFRKYWPEAELSALFTQERVFGEKRILPVVHAMTAREVAASWPLLAARAAAYSSDGVEAVAGKINAAVRQVEAPRVRGVSRLFGVPDTRSVQFVGREHEIEQLGQLLRRPDSDRIAASVEGLAGVGKTELALQLVYKLAAEGAFPGGIFWFDAENPDLTAAWGTVIADAQGISEGSVAERASQAVRLVSRKTAPVLIVLDNVTRWSTTEKPAPLPGGAHLRFLLTTRQRRLGGPRFQHLAVGFLEREFAGELLASAAGRDLAPLPGHEDLLEYLGGHALAIALAGAFLAEYPEETPASYLAELRAGAPVEREVSEQLRYSQTVTQAFETIWHRLGEEARHTWRLAASFEPELVSLELSEAVGLDAANRRLLRRRHLIETDQVGRWRMHRLTREFGRRSGTEQELGEARTAFVTGCAKFIDQIDLATGFRLYLANRAHLDSALKEAPGVFAEDDPRWSLFLGHMGTALHSAGDLSPARELLERALDSHLQNFGKDRPELATSHSNLGWVLKEMGDLPAAREQFEQALTLDVDNFGEDHSEVASSRSNLALVLKARGELEAARELLEQALASNLDNLDEDHSEVASNRSNLAGVLLAQGDLPAARELLEQALASDLREFGEDHPKVAIRRSNLSTVLRKQGDLPAARELLELALATGLESLGEDHPKVAIRRSKLALVLKAQGDLAAARKMLERALASNLEVLGEEHPNVATSRASLALVLEAQGDLPAAREMAREAVETASQQPEGSLVRTRVEAELRGILGDS